MPDYLPIENHGVIGDMNTIALVGINGCIDFMCFPDFDSPTIFASLLDKEKGGYFSVSPSHKDLHTKQLYLPDTNVLLTRFLSDEGVGEITDFMPIEEEDKSQTLARRVTAVRGEMEFHMQCRPRFNYARSHHEAEQVGDHEIIFRSKREEGVVLRLKSNVKLTLENGDAYADFKLHGKGQADFILETVEQHKPSHAEHTDYLTKRLYETVNFWKDWVSKSKYFGRWQDMVHRSALTLKMLTSKKHGSMVAAPTLGLPEAHGGVRNWDYRYTWIRDASFTIYALIRLGYTKEAGSFMNWVEKKCVDIGRAGYLGLMYKLDGGGKLEEEVLDHLEGYQRATPIRVGNNAYKQLQLDIYGELMDAVYLYNKYGEPISINFWKELCEQINWLCDNWKRKDRGIWEVRGGEKHFIYSRLMCWVALERAIRIATERPFPLDPRWIKERDKIYQSIFTDFWDKQTKSFVQFQGAETTDATTLLMPLIRFIGPKDPMWLSTLRRIEDELVSDSLVYRYRPEVAAPDGINSHEGTFSMCTFWYVECLSRAGYLQKARLYFEKMIGYANHLGLYSEQLGFKGEHLGNFPQAFTHLGLISAAYNLDAQLNDERNKGASRRVYYY